VLTASGGNITIENQASGNNNGIYLNGSTAGQAQLTALNGTITLNGGSGSGTGVLVSNSVLNAAQATISGRSDSGGGFSLTNSTLAGALADLANVTLSSAGSGGGVINTLDSSVVNDASRDNLLAKRIENMTTVDMNGTAIFDDSAKADKGWTHDYSPVDTPNGGWIFNNTRVTAGGDVNLKGAAFTNATLTVSNGSLTLDNGGAAPLTGSTLTVNDGAVSVHAGAGNIDLTNGNISAKGDISLKADAGSVIIAGANATAKANITSVEGNITISGNGGNSVGVAFSNSVLNSVNMNITGTTVKGGNSTDVFGGVDIYAANEFHVANGGKGKIYGSSQGGGQYYLEGGIVIGRYWNDGAHVLFDGDFDIKGKSMGGGEVSFNRDSAGILLNFPTPEITFTRDSTVSGEGVNAAMGISVFYNYNRPVSKSQFIINNASVVMNFNSDLDAGVGVLLPSEYQGNSQGFSFSGDGNVSINVSSGSEQGAFILNQLDNTGFTGGFNLNVTNTNGDAILLPGWATINLVNATITGTSSVGAGVRLDANDKANVNLGNNAVYGTSETGMGIQITGNNITLSNGTLNGTVTSGSGAGVVLTGGSNYILDGASVTGTSADGAGVAVNGTLTVNNGTTVEGHATGSGSGVQVSGNLATDTGDGVLITGTALSGDGIKVDGDTTLTNATLTG
ncbi:hypothetical protein IS386_004606, partial [Salmonella enterica]|nr:hypothetical protein [Salmonella enterica]